ncbi:MAG: phosphatidylserine decarboxylase [Gammaproteobacteria bacterium]|nr:phosphatidylserine decarboxylase [Gammaproteobacteria bacterium]
MRLREWISVLPQYALPQHALARVAYSLTRWRFGPWKNLSIRWFCARFRVDLGEAENENAESYPTFNAFFTRALKPGARPVDTSGHAVISPVDGIVSRAGRLDGGMIVQAKGRSYSVDALLGPDSGSGEFADGAYFTLYLSPRHYHRVHMPLRGRLEQMTYIPGRLFSVNEVTTNQVPGLFTRNERLVFRFATHCGPVVVCMVGAIFVAGMETVWHGEVAPARNRQWTRYDYVNRETAITFDKGAEIARFNMGSTVILLFGKDVVEWDGSLVPGVEVKMGQQIGIYSTFPSPGYR